MILSRDYGVNRHLGMSDDLWKRLIVKWESNMHQFFIEHYLSRKWIILVDNSNIVIRDLSKDGIHLLQSGRIKLAENSY